jgi:hypothetical protein
MPLNVMRNSSLIPLKLPTHRTHHNIHLLLLPRTPLLSPPLIRLLQRAKQPIVPRRNFALIIKILVFLPNIPFNSSTPHSKSTPTTPTTIPTQIRPRPTNDALPPLTFLYTNNPLHAPHTSIA